MDLYQLKKLAITAVLIVGIGGSIASGSSSTGSGSGSDTGKGDSATSNEKEVGASDEVDDVKLTKCFTDDMLGYPKATIKVTNNSSKASDYLIEVTFESKDGKTQFGTGNTIISNLKPGQTKTEDVMGLDKGKGKMVCSVSSVDRMASS